MRSELDYWRRRHAPWADFMEEQYYRELVSVYRGGRQHRNGMAGKGRPASNPNDAFAEAVVRNGEKHLLRLRRRNAFF